MCPHYKININGISLLAKNNNLSKRDVQCPANPKSFYLFIGIELILLVQGFKLFKVNNIEEIYVVPE